MSRNESVFKLRTCRKCGGVFEATASGIKSHASNCEGKKD